MSSMGDGVSKFFLVYHDMGSMNFHGERTLNDVAALAMRTASYREGYRERLVQHIADMKNLLVTYDFKMSHEHEWEDSVAGDEIVGKHCSCGAIKDE